MSSWFQSYGFADILPNLIIGAYPLDERDVRILQQIGVTRVFNLVQDGEYRPQERLAVTEALSASPIEEHRLSLVDFGSLPTEALEEAVQAITAWLDAGTRVYVHCRAGWQRSAAVAAGVVALREGLTIDDAIEFVQRRKPSADPLPHQREDLARWWAGRQAAAN